ncbi:MAG: hypothetical protein AAFX92_10320 [Pseudomonadota bacterium]
MMPKGVLCSILAAMTALSGASAAHADENDGCLEFTLMSTGENRVVAYHDTGEPGIGLGDVRVGVRSLIDEEGNDAGLYRWYITSIDPVAPAGTTGAALYRGYFLLADGMIMTEAVYEPAAAVENTETVSVTSGERAIVAGTGNYRAVTGYMLEDVVERFGEGGRPLEKTFAFTLNC